MTPHDPFDAILHFFPLELTAISLRAKFKVSCFNRSRDIGGGVKNCKSRSRDPHMTPFDLMLRFFVRIHCRRLHAKFEVSSFNRWRDIRGSQNSKIGSRDPHMTPFDPILHFFRYKSPTSVSVPNLKFLAPTVREILGGSQNFKSGSRDLDMTPF